MTTIQLKSGHSIEIDGDQYFEVLSAPAPASICGRERIRFCEVTDLLQRHGKKSELAQFDPMHFMRGEELTDNTPSNKEDM